MPCPGGEIYQGDLSFQNAFGWTDESDPISTHSDTYVACSSCLFVCTLHHITDISTHTHLTRAPQHGTMEIEIDDISPQINYITTGTAPLGEKGTWDNGYKQTGILKPVSVPTLRFNCLADSSGSFSGCLLALHQRADQQTPTMSSMRTRP